jgi:hypothetical protein
MSRGRYLSFLVLGVALLLVVQASLAFAKSPNKILEWGTMVGVPSGLTGAQSLAPMRGIPGGGVPWTLNRGQGQLKADGDLEIEVDGLVLATTGSNPAAAFRALVSCVNANGTFTNVLTTDTFPATLGLASAGGGDASIETHVTLPTPCIAPIVFVTSGGGSWFASTGR